MQRIGSLPAKAGGNPGIIDFPGLHSGYKEAASNKVGARLNGNIFRIRIER